MPTSHGYDTPESATIAEATTPEPTQLRLERENRQGMRPIIAATTLLQLAHDRLLSAARDLEETPFVRRQAQELGEELLGLAGRLYCVVEAEG